MMGVTPRQLNRATLQRQRLLERAALDVPEAVRRVVAIQAQQNASPYVALWNRVAGFDPAALDAAFAAREVVKATLMRITLHAVHTDDYPAFHAAMQTTLRAGLGDERFTASGLTADDAVALVPELVAFASEPRTNAECETFLGGKAAWWGLRRFAPLHHAVTGGPWSFEYRPAYVGAAPAPVEDPVTHLVRRYLEGFGPATAQDVAQFAMLPQSRLRDALAAMERLEGHDGVTLYDVAGATLPDKDTPAPPRLMAMWDSVLLAYADRGRVIPPDHRPHVTRRNGDVLPTLLVDGSVAGVWRPLEGGIEATAFEPLPDDVWEALAVEAHGLVDFLADREPTVYSRYAHWWDKLPRGDVRVL